MDEDQLQLHPSKDDGFNDNENKAEADMGEAGGGAGKHCDHGNHGNVDVYFDVYDKVGRMLLVLMDWTLQLSNCRS